MHPLVLLCAAVVAGVALSPDAAGDLAGWQLCALAAAAVAALVGVRVEARPGWRLAHAALLVGGLALGIAAARRLPAGPLRVGPLRLEGRVAGAAVGWSADVEVSSIDGAPAAGRVRAMFPQRPPPPGTELALRGEAGPYPDPVLPGAPDPVRAASLAGVRTWVRVDALRVAGEERPAPARPADPTGLILGFALGDTSGVSDETMRILRDTGTLHLLSVSGFHVGVLAGLVAAAAARATRLVALIRPRGVPEAPALLLAALAGASYCVVAGAPVPAQRAALGLLVVAVGQAAGREIDPLVPVALAAAVTAVADPSCVASASWQLTFGAMVGLVRLADRVTRLVPPDLPWIARKLAEGVAATFGATLGTLPASAWWFQQLPKLALPANLIALPLGALLVPLAGVAVFAPDPLAGWSATLCTLGARVLLAALAPLAVAPWHPATGPAGALALALVLVVGPPRPGPWLAAALFAFGLEERATVPTATFLAVGQGDAILLEDADTRLLVDGGPPGDAVARWLRRTGRRDLDVLLTHGHLDHYGGLLPVISDLRPRSVAFRDTEGLGPVREAAARAGVGLTWATDALAPAPGYLPEDVNDRSVVVRWSAFVLPGDLEAAGEQRILDAVGPAPVLKVGHHGSRGATSDAWLCAVRPSLAVISAGYDNGYGHPHAALLQRLLAHGVRAFRTDLDGTIEVAVHPDALVVRRWRAGSGWSAPERYPLATEGPCR